MLSVLDLLEAGTLDPDLAAWLMARMGRGASLLVGARPGGAGKTTVMCALLNLAPPALPLVAATAEAVARAAAEDDPPRRCYVCHEISPGDYFAYLWGDDLRAYCRLFEKGHVLASNLHADDLPEARAQVCDANGVSEALFGRFDLAVFLRVGGRPGRARRTVEKVYAADGEGRHRLVFDAAAGLRPAPTGAEESARVAACGQFLAEALADGVRTIEHARRRAVAFLATCP